MSEAGANGSVESPGAAKSSAPKDRNCPYCGQAFTSSSLGRHLDLYIKEKNPKAPDGIHDVEAIRKMRGNITRRQPRGSLTRRDTSNPGTPTASSSTTKKSPVPEHTAKGPGPAIPKEGQFVVDHQTPKFPFQPTWEATGVINDIPTKRGELRGSWDENAGQDPSRNPNAQRVPGRVAQKAQLDARQKLADAMDTARAAELALREVFSSLRAAKQHIDMNSLPFDFDPLSLDFPALTLQCLQAPPTLFSSTPHPTSTSWSIQPPAQKQFEALKSYFQEEFRKWRVACAAATTVTAEDLTYPPSNTHYPHDIRENIKKAEKAAASMEKQVNEHLESTYHVWDQLSPHRKSELWGVELARGLGRRQKDVEKLKQSHHFINQENANLKTQIEQLNRLQHPREFRIMPPATLPIEESLISYLCELGVKGEGGVGFSMDGRHSDLSTVVSRAIERWKSVIVSSRGPGMTTQRPLDQTTPIPTPTSATSASIPTPQPKQTAPASHPPYPQHRAMPATSNGPSHDSRPATTATTPVTTAPTSGAHDDNSDQDADAEMDEDDNFTTPITPAVSQPPPQQQQQQPPLEMSRTRGHSHQSLTPTTDTRFVANGNGGNRGLNMRQSMPNVNPATAMQGRGHGQHGHAIMNNGDYGPVVTGVGGGDPMYMD